MPYDTHIKFPSDLFPDKISDIEVTNISEDQNTIWDFQTTMYQTGDFHLHTSCSIWQRLS